MRPRIALLALVACTPACLSGNYGEFRTRSELPSVAGLAAGSAELTECLDVLGAPILVREYGDGAVLAWGWAREKGWGATLSVPVTDSNSASFAYNSANQGMDGLVLFFDEHWVLEQKRRGPLASVLPSSQKRAQLVE